MEQRQQSLRNYGMNSVRKNAHLLQTILAIRPSIGDGFSDDELTQLLRTTLLGPEILQDLSAFYSPDTVVTPIN